MDSDKTTASPFERRVSTRNSRRVSVHMRESEMEEVDTNYEAMAMADGFGPRTQTVPIQNTTPQIDAMRPSSQHTLSTALAAEPGQETLASPNGPESTDAESMEVQSRQTRASQGQRPSSIAKPPRSGNDSISLQHTGGMTRITEGSAMSRMSSISSASSPFISAEGPYQGPSHPSHPYGVYIQNAGLARTMSVATTSTAPVPESSFAGSPASTHPYGMYQQGTVESVSLDPAVIPVGFGGRGNQYQRRLGADGEEVADMVGPDGHTEQLPPYSREPPAPSPYDHEAGARKAREAALAAAAMHPTIGPVAGPASAASSLSAPPNQIAGAGGLGLATRNPEFEGTDEPATPRSRHSSRSLVTEASQHNINTAAAAVVMSEKTKPLNKWQAWGRRRCCGVVPYWALVLAITVVVLVAALVIGAVVGTQLRDNHRYPPPRKGGSQWGDVATTTVTYDAIPVPTPTDLPGLVTGSFSLPLMMASRASSICFNDTTQSQAWNCNVALITQALMTIQQDSDAQDPGGYTISITCNESLSISNNVYAWGSQPGLIREPQRLELVNDTNNPGRGPAWFKMVSFNKTIVLPERALTPTPTAGSVSAARLARDMHAYNVGNRDLKRKAIAQPGDKVWVCEWPETTLEVFIYPMQNSSWARPTTGAGSSLWASQSPGPLTTSSTSPSVVSMIPTQTVREGSKRHLDGRQGGDLSSPALSPTVTTTTGSGPTPSPTGNWPPPGNGSYVPTPLYPRVVKIEERRGYRPPMPSCRQVEIQGDGQPPRPVKDEDGNNIVVYIVENESTPPGTSNRGLRDDPLSYRAESSDMSECGCIWFTT